MLWNRPEAREPPGPLERPEPLGDLSTALELRDPHSRTLQAVITLEAITRLVPATKLHRKLRFPVDLPSQASDIPYPRNLSSTTCQKSTPPPTILPSASPTPPGDATCEAKTSSSSNASSAAQSNHCSSGNGLPPYAKAIMSQSSSFSEFPSPTTTSTSSTNTPKALASPIASETLKTLTTRYFLPGSHECRSQRISPTVSSTFTAALAKMCVSSTTTSRVVM
uniref:Uncharacterized protein n=1 Tax=Nelumbo nucifera TaxID=4432 RepID=A0A822ZNN7_NELNU|nr:TPA_asm: hypothetical protein HUJ06_001628 [Nelumbo nucifera]